MEQIGWSLVDKSGAELQHWGDRPGECAAVPSRIVLGPLMCVEAPSPGAVGECSLVPRHYQWGGSAVGPSFDGAAVVVTGALDALKAQTTAQIKDAARAVRDVVRTPGKDMVYAEKKDQAHAVIAMGKEAANALENNGAAQFPLLAGTVGIEAPTLFDLAELVWSKYEMWNALSYHIERAEASGTKAISDASDAAAVKAAYEAITWPTLP
jgi:hypothetical protein